MLSEIKSMFPTWVLSTNFVYSTITAFIFSLIICWIVSSVSLIQARKAKDLHWTEIARLIYPTRRIMSVLFLVVSAAFAITYISSCGELTIIPSSIVLIVVLICSVVGSIIGNNLAFKRISKKLNRKQSNSGWLFTLLIYNPALVVTVFFFCFQPYEISLRNVALLFAEVVTIVYLGYDPLIFAKLIRLICPASDRLNSIVEGLSSKMKIPVNATYEIKTSYANALAHVFKKELVFTTETLEILSDDELSGIAAHELAHLTEPLKIKIARMTRLMFLVIFLLLPFITRNYGLYASAGLVFAGVFVHKIICQMSRKMEKRADEQAFSLEEHKISYARALEKIYETNLIPAVLSKRFKTHPDLYDRIVNAGLTPDYPRPKAPEGVRFRVILLFVVLLIFTGITVIWYIPRTLENFVSTNENRLLFKVGLTAGGRFTLANYALAERDNGNVNDALKIYEYAISQGAGNYVEVIGFMNLLSDSQSCGKIERLVKIFANYAPQKNGLSDKPTIKQLDDLDSYLRTRCSD